MSTLAFAPAVHVVTASFTVNFESSALDRRAYSAPDTAVVEETKPTHEELIRSRDDKQLIAGYKRYQDDLDDEKLLAVVRKVLKRKFDPFDGEWQSTDGQDEQDRLQEALVAIWKGLRSRTLSDANDFPKQVQKCVNNQELEGDKQIKRSRRRFVPFELQDEYGNEYDNPAALPSEDAPANSIPWEVLTDEERMITNAYLTLTQEEVAERFGVSVKTISRRFEQIAEKIRNHQPTSRGRRSKK